MNFTQLTTRVALIMLYRAVQKYFHISLLEFFEGNEKWNQISHINIIPHINIVLKSFRHGGSTQKCKSKNKLTPAGKNKEK